MEKFEFTEDKTNFKFGLSRIKTILQKNLKFDRNTLYFGLMIHLNLLSNPYLFDIRGEVRRNASSIPYKKIGTYETKLTTACRSGAFMPSVHGKYIVKTKDKELDVALGNGANLRDEKKQADPSKVYLFYDAGIYYGAGISQSCEVYSQTRRFLRLPD